MRALGAWLVALVVVLGAPAAAAATATIGPAAQTLAETAGPLSFTVTRDAVGVLGSTAAVPVTVSLGRPGDTGACPADVTPCAVMVSVAGNQFNATTGTATFTRVDDALDEVDETVGAHITAAPGEQFDPSVYAVATLTDDDASPGVTLAGAGVAEGTGPAPTTLALPVTLDAPSGRAVSVGYELTAGTATGEDVSLASGTVAIPAGLTTGSIPAQVVADAVDEEETEAFTATLTAADGATLPAPAARTATATITDDDTATLALTGDVAATEGTGATTPLTFGVRLSTPSSRTVTVTVATADGTATAPGDYGAVRAGLTFAPGETEKAVVVDVVGDGTIEADERFVVRLEQPVGAGLGTDAASGTIRNDDVPPPAVAPPGGMGAVGVGGAFFSGGGAAPVTAGAGGDDTAPRGRLTRVTLRRPRTVRSSFACPAGEQECRVAVTVFTVPAPRGRVPRLRRELRLGRTTLTVAGGARGAVALRLPAATLALLRRAGSTKVVAYAVVRDAAGNVGTTRAPGTLVF